MKNKPVLILVALLGIAAVVFGVLQMSRGIDELRGDGLPSAADARAAADSAAGKLSRHTVAGKRVSLLYPQDWTVTTPQPPVLCSFKTFKGVVNYSLMSEDVAADTQLAAYIDATANAIKGALAKPEQALQMLGCSSAEASDRRDAARSRPRIVLLQHRAGRACCGRTPS